MWLLKTRGNVASEELKCSIKHEIHTRVQNLVLKALECKYCANNLNVESFAYFELNKIYC